MPSLTSRVAVTPLTELYESVFSWNFLSASSSEIGSFFKSISDFAVCLVTTSPL